jgi:hypothetical protein
MVDAGRLINPRPSTLKRRPDSLVYSATRTATWSIVLLGLELHSFSSSDRIWSCSPARSFSRSSRLQVQQIVGSITSDRWSLLRAKGHTSYCPTFCWKEPCVRALVPPPSQEEEIGDVWTGLSGTRALRRQACTHGSEDACTGALRSRLSIRLACLNGSSSRAKPGPTPSDYERK